MDADQTQGQKAAQGSAVSKKPSTVQFVQPTEEQKALMQVYRDKYETLLNEIRALQMNRGLSIAITKLEESAMWINKSITNNC